MLLAVVPNLHGYVSSLRKNRQSVFIQQIIVRREKDIEEHRELKLQGFKTEEMSPRSLTRVLEMYTELSI